MKICVLGAGALGCSIGGVLTEAGQDVWLINRSRAHVDAMNASGLRMLDAGVERRVTVKAALDSSDVGIVDLIIVLVKSYDTAAAIASAAPMIGEHTQVLSLQNGLGHEDILVAAVGAHRVLAGKTYVGGVMTGPGRITIGTRGKQTIIGELDGSVSERVSAIAAVFNRAGLETTVSPNILGTIWDKLLINVATGALAGITGLGYGDLYSVDEIADCATAAVAEAMAVARANSVELSLTEPRQAWDMAGAGLPAGFKTSMLQSLEKGSKTEIDFINGAVVRWGERCGVATPVNSTLVACIKGIERRLAV
ncbi:2-dehydropantoate 2-reductase [Marinobacterium aestuarii]|uniref:2-dehydropantoate 2-reductase n=1 Tax=Marinobacterium aestuarii TaxID=1821621 RepID=A0A1A9F5P4_9GAMM|nr:ketopantoate reductase family protein [Marinobacterium aestuarii]ANG65079.1 2-dehydropantoate 2-reductase [Marinobacterium aestuarii]